MLSFSRGSPSLRKLNIFFSTFANPQHYDIAIVGGGMVGFGFAAIAASHPMLRSKKILLLESGSEKRYEKQLHPKNRVVALTPATRDILEGAGAWKTIEKTRVQNIFKMKVFESGSAASILLERNNPLDPMAYMVENDLIISALSSAVEANKSFGSVTYPGTIDIIHNAVIEDVKLPNYYNDKDFPEFSYRRRTDTDSISVTASILIAADGAKSMIREKAGIHTIGWEHDQTAIVANLNLPDDFDCTIAWQRFIDSGPIALLPLGPNKCSTTWSTTRKEATRLMALDDETFVNELNRCLSEPPQKPTGVISSAMDQIRRVFIRKLCDFRPPKILSVDPGTRAAFPLMFRHATFYHGSRVALIGDAAHRILPLSGQGVNMGLGDADSLAKHLNRALQVGGDLASPNVLQAYTNDRQRSVVPMACFIEFLQRLYSADATLGPFESSYIRKLTSAVGISGALRGVRGLGLDVVDSSDLVKKFFVEGAVSGRIKIPMFN